ncbi:hypothetical protein [Microbispora siamensis]|uniref:Uncharacterized protein n=1 Tax=Microbispora siamensis TaxID=564413 RepID=A0ABQ4GQT0_9ACTN|nr:hypothetical protein [Microbispora siamensis]GIH63800.1 hypothetical protein Msi02_46170 [Microbispora siamensis]
MNTVVGRALAFLGTGLGLLAGCGAMIRGLFDDGPVLVRVVSFAFGALLVQHLVRGLVREWRRPGPAASASGEAGEE